MHFSRANIFKRKSSTFPTSKCWTFWGIRDKDSSVNLLARTLLHVQINVVVSVWARFQSSSCFNISFKHFLLLWWHINGINWSINKICISRCHDGKGFFFWAALWPFCLHLTDIARFIVGPVMWVGHFSVTLLQEVCFSFRQSVWHYLSKWTLDRSPGRIVSCSLQTDLNKKYSQLIRIFSTYSRRSPMVLNTIAIFMVSFSHFSAQCNRTWMQAISGRNYKIVSHTCGITL